MKIKSTLLAAFVACTATCAAADDDYVGLGMGLSLPQIIFVERSEKNPQQDDVTTYPFLRVSKLVCDGPAARAGVRVGDAITRIGDMPVEDVTLEEQETAVATITGGSVGEPVLLIIARGSLDDGTITLYAKAPERAQINPADLSSECAE